MSNGKSLNKTAFEPLGQVLQLGERVYQALLSGIVSGQIDLGTQLRTDSIAHQLEVSTTPVREALGRLEKDGLVVKTPYQGWFVREFDAEEVRDLYELRAGLESFSIQLACQRITEEELEQLHEHQATGESALKQQDLEAYRIYNRDLHAAFMRAARNSHLALVMSQLTHQSQMLMARTIRVLGRPSRAIEEHRQLIELVSKRAAEPAADLMSRHVLSALEDIFQYGLAGTTAGTRTGSQIS